MRKLSSVSYRLVLMLQLTTALIRKAEEAVNGIIPKLGNQGSVADLSQCSPRASVQQLMHATRSLGAIPAVDGSAAGTDEEDDVGIASSSRYSQRSTCSSVLAIDDSRCKLSQPPKAEHHHSIILCCYCNS